MRTFKLALLVIALHLATTSLSAWAVPIANLYNTGLDASGNYLPTAGLDGNYTVISSPAGSFVPSAVDDTSFPFPIWVANSPLISRWVGTSAQSSNGPAGTYVYRTSFNLPANANLGSVAISGMWGTDDPGLDILINGSSTSQISGGFTVLVPFSITSGFQIGNNDLDFILQNASGPTGLRIDKIVGNYLVPEPASLFLAVMSIGCMLMGRRV